MGFQPGDAPSGPPTGQPPEMAALIHRLRRDGKAMGVLVMMIVFLMVVKPSAPSDPLKGVPP